MNVKELKYVYFVGIGGIGMSALARYFNFYGKKVSGYDRTASPLTQTLTDEGILIHYIDSINNIPAEIRNIENKHQVLVVYTPAIPKDSKELRFFFTNGFIVLKRSQVLGLIIKDKRGIAIAGTHGKTSVTTTTSHLLKQSTIDCSAFLGGISKNYQTNFLFSKDSDYVVVEADEYDRSFHQLFPEIAVVTAMDADHLDIYGTHEAVIESFYQFMKQITVGGILILKQGLNIEPIQAVLDNHAVKVFSYSFDNPKSDFHATNIRKVEGKYLFDIKTPTGTISNISFNLPGPVNIENSVAAAAVAYSCEMESQEIADGLASFFGVKRRFDYHLKTDSIVYIDDYAHHPEEIKACLTAIRDFYPTKKITTIFQPHLFSRTKDFAAEFAESLSLCDELLLLDIYPARELPMEGVTSKIIFDNVTCKEKSLITKDEILSIIDKKNIEVLLTVGAGDVDSYCDAIKELLTNKLEHKNC
jgi:UDP-N-acetylmuramate--alanine ligase